ncbi:MAG TPA: hypothetical protein VJJ72_00830 [Candidatus Paceibacterota bacterium]
MPKPERVRSLYGTVLIEGTPPPKKEKTPEPWDVISPRGHIKPSFLKAYAENPDKLPDLQRRAVENHLRGCQDRTCLNTAEKIRGGPLVEMMDKAS